MAAMIFVLAQTWNRDILHVAILDQEHAHHDGETSVALVVATAWVGEVANNIKAMHLARVVAHHKRCSRALTLDYGRWHCQASQSGFNRNDCC